MAVAWQMKSVSKKGSGLKDLLQAAAEGQREFSIKFDSRFEVGLPIRVSCTCECI